MFELEFAVGGFVAIGFSAVIYLLYFFLVLRSRELTNYQQTLSAVQNSNAELEPVSVIVNTFNEAKVIERKLVNISELNYDLSKLEVIVIDDASVDGTCEKAEGKMHELKLPGRIIRNSTRIGLNRSLNLAMAEAKYDLICVTDSDVMLEKNALRNAVNVLTNFDDINGVTGKVQPIFDGQGFAQSSETAYRGFYDNSMMGETSLHSAFPGNGPLIVFNKALVSSTIPVDYGSTDGNIAMNVIKSGGRFVYVSNAVIFEPVPENMGQQRLQKVRRAQRLIQVFLHNKGVFLNKKYGKFGRVVFPLKFLMVIVNPFLLFFGSGLLIASFVLSANLLLGVLLGGALFGVLGFSSVCKRVGRNLSSFVFHQVYLLLGLFTSVRKSVFWKTIDRNKVNLQVVK